MHAILTYHSLDDSGSPISLAPAAFARHVAFLASGAVEVLPLRALLAAPHDGGHRVALTFDDGFANFAEHAWPRLREHGLPATLYVVADHVGRTNRWNGVEAPGIPTLPLLGWERLAALHAEGLELGIHGQTHTALRGREEGFVAQEIEATRDAIRARTGAHAEAFAYPYGVFDAVALAVARRVTASAVTTHLDWLGAHADHHRLPRLDAYYFARAGRLEGFGGGAFRRFVRARRLLRGLRAAVGAWVRRGEGGP